MSNQIMHFWTLNTLVGAFLDLFIAYFMLCASTFAFFVCKFLGLFGLSLPNPSHEVKNLLVDYPTDKISSVQLYVTRKYPFDSIFIKNQNFNVDKGMNLGRGDGDGLGFRELEGEASCSSKSDARKVARNESDDVGFERETEREFDMKGKGVMNHRLRGGFRRRRKGSFDNGKHSSVSSSPNWITCVDQQGNSQSPLSIDKEQSGRFEDEVETPMVVKSEDGYSQNLVFNEPGDRNIAQKRITLDDEDKDNTIMTLARELEEEQAARAALYVELEKERNAAASAADEAMAMILRLQEEKASIEMESRQYQRIIEEKSAYDEEEMNILKEILMRREREKHFLEKEVEAYRQMINLENEQFGGGAVEDFSEDPDLMLHQLSVSVAKKKNSRWQKDVDFPKQEPEKTIPIVEEDEINEGDASQGSNDMYDKFGDMEPLVYDVHVIDDEPKLSDESNRNKNQQLPVDEIDGGFLRRLGKETDQNRSGSRGLSSRRHSTSALDNERTKIDTEVEWLRERLRIVQEGREKLNLSMDYHEKETLQLQLLEDITRQLQEIRMMTEPRKARQTSLPPISSKGLTKKRRCQSVSSGLANST